jgi:hypothetical protein
MTKCLICGLQMEGSQDSWLHLRERGGWAHAACVRKELQDLERKLGLEQRPRPCEALRPTPLPPPDPPSVQGPRAQAPRPAEPEKFSPREFRLRSR